MPVANASYKPKILVVEDSYLAAEAVCSMVTKCGFDVAGSVGSVETGIKFVRENTLDGAVIDIDLHGTPSFPICEQLRQRAIPFVFLTGYDRRFAVPEEFRTAPWLQKPVGEHEFEAAIVQLGRAGASQQDRGNLLLERLAADDWQELMRHLEPVALQAGDVLGGDSETIQHFYFPKSGLISVIARSSAGKAIEMALLARESVIGVEAVLGRAGGVGLDYVVQVSGAAWRARAADVVALLGSRPALRAELMGALHDLLRQMSDNAVAVGNGTIEQRLARRLLMASARLGSRSLAMTHEALARLLAVRRSGVTVALHMLESRRLIRSRRNLVEIVDYEGLRRAAGKLDLGHIDGGAPPSR
jgi:CRP-like cAMP-binding protein